MTTSDDVRERLARLLPEVANGWLDEQVKFDHAPKYFLREADRIMAAFPVLAEAPETGGHRSTSARRYRG